MSATALLAYTTGAMEKISEPIVAAVREGFRNSLFRENLNQSGLTSEQLLQQKYVLANRAKLKDRADLDERLKLLKALAPLALRCKRLINGKLSDTTRPWGYFAAIRQPEPDFEGYKNFYSPDEEETLKRCKLMTQRYNFVYRNKDFYWDWMLYSDLGKLIELHNLLEQFSFAFHAKFGTEYAKMTQILYMVSNELRRITDRIALPFSRRSSVVQLSKDENFRKRIARDILEHCPLINVTDPEEPQDNKFCEIPFIKSVFDKHWTEATAAAKKFKEKSSAV
jgi:hypothetical protein